MKANEYVTVLRAWLRLPGPDLAEALAASRKSGVMPAPRIELAPSHAAAGLLATMVASLSGPGPLRDRVADTCALALEAPDGVDPLDAMPRDAFCKMVGRTAGSLAANGYLTLCEAVGVALGRQEQNFGQVELERVTLRMHGTALVGVLEAKTPTGPCVWNFTKSGAVASRSGLWREVSVGPAVLSGIGFVLSADEARAAART